MDDRTRIGAAVRSARLRRGMSVEVLAGLAGHSKSWLSKVERGLLPLERRADLVGLADGLGVSPADLTGQPYDDDERVIAAGAMASVPAIRRALFDTPAPAGGDPAAAVEAVTVARQAYRLDDAARMLPGLILSLRAASDPATIRQRCWAWSETGSLLRDLGESDLALIVLDRLTADADLLEDRALAGVAAFQRAHTLSSTPVGAFAAAAYEADSAGDAMAGVGGPAAAASLGGLRLAAAFAWGAAGRPDEAVARLDEAGELATRVDGPTDVPRHTAFGAPNVGLHRISVGVEAGDPDSAVRAAGDVRPDDLPWESRRASYWADLGRAHAQLADDGAAVTAFRQAELIAPLRVRLHPLVREAVAGMVTRAHERAVGRDLRGLAYRMGVAH